MSNKVNLNTAAKMLELTPFYVRKCIREDKLEATLEQIPGKNVERWMIDESEIERFASREKKSVGKRDDGRNKYTLYATRDEYAAVVEMLESIDFETSLLARANPPKTG